MRLWHKDLIPFLPNKMLVSQWRECIAIKRQWEKGTLKHRLVSYVQDYNKSTFCLYCIHVATELNRRNIKYKQSLLKELLDFTDYKPLQNYKEHNLRYLEQCLLNLQEKADRGIINVKEWEVIESNFWLDLTFNGGRYYEKKEEK